MNQGKHWRYVTDPTGELVQVDFGEWKCNVLMERYEHDEMSLSLVDPTDYSRICRATSNLTDSCSASNEVLIKDYAENAGVLDALVDTGLLDDTGRAIESDHSQLNVLRMSDDLQDQWQGFLKQLPPPAPLRR